MTLSSKERAELRAEAHHLSAIVHIGHHGLTEALRTGHLQNQAKSGQTPFFEALYADPARLRGFLAAMTGLSHGANLAIAPHRR